MLIGQKPSDLINAPERWTRGAYARDEWGIDCDPEDPAAVRWDLVGAVAKVCRLPVRAAIQYAAFRLKVSPVTLNDCRGYYAVMMALKNAGM